MAIEVKNLRIKVNINGQKKETATSDSQINWTSEDIMDALQQVIKNQKER